jgi:hypothetical protein
LIGHNLEPTYDAYTPARSPRGTPIPTSGIPPA